MSDWQALAQEQLARWGLTKDAADAAGLFAVANAAKINHHFDASPAIVIPYFTLDGAPMWCQEGTPFCRVRYLVPPSAPAGFAGASKPQRYGQPPESGVRAYFPPGADYAKGAIITEGEAKALRGAMAGFPIIALGGVWNFTDKVSGGLLPELQEIGWNGKKVVICFDSDAATNPHIQAAESRLAEEFLRRGARVSLARLPGNADGGKVGLDDYLEAEGAGALQARLNEAAPLGRLDAAILALNEHLAWIEFENSIFDFKSHAWLSKSSLLQGSRYSAIKIPGPTRMRGRRPASGTNEIQVASAWLTSQFARRYDRALFVPGAGAEIRDDNERPALNLWNGWHAEEGDVAPWLELGSFLFGELPEQYRELPVKWLAYKAQHPARKIPLALVMVGNEGTGKSLWCEIVRDAFAPYGVELSSEQLRSPFQGWLEKSLLCVINEAKGDDVTFGSDNLKTLISDETRPMNEKYRPVRQVKSYSSYILTSNRREVAAYGADNRRMFCLSTPGTPRETEFYERIAKWRRAGGPRAVMHYLLSLDLGDWEPPARAPLTQEKAAAFAESLTPIQELANDCREQGGLEVIKRWLEWNHAWAERTAEMKGPGAHGAFELLSIWDSLQLRPWYTAKEISKMFPFIAVTLYGNRKLIHTPAGEISRQLREAGIEYLLCRDDPRGFMLQGKREQYLILAEFDRWREPITQQEFEKLIRSFPRYNKIRGVAPK